MLRALTIVSLLLLAGGSCSKETSPNEPPPATVGEPTVADSTQPPQQVEPTPDPAPPEETGPTLHPVDQAPRDPTFLTFRERLRDAVKRKDREFLLSTLSPTIRVSFGGAAGVRDFIRYWKLDSPNSPIWSELDELLHLGGTFETIPEGPTRFCAPYVYSAYPENGPDAFESLVVLRPDVPLREQPNSSAKTIAMLSYDIVNVSRSDPLRQGKGSMNWWQVRTARGKQGWVEDRFVRSSIDYRACFEQFDRDWKMVLLVAGD